VQKEIKMPERNKNEMQGVQAVVRGCSNKKERIGLWLGDRFGS